MTKRAFKVKEKAFFIIFQALSTAKNCLRPEKAPLSNTNLFEMMLCNYPAVFINCATIYLILSAIINF